MVPRAPVAPMQSETRDISRAQSGSRLVLRILQSGRNHRCQRFLGARVDHRVFGVEVMANPLRGALDDLKDRGGERGVHRPGYEHKPNRRSTSYTAKRGTVSPVMN